MYPVDRGKKPKRCGGRMRKYRKVIKGKVRKNKNISTVRVTKNQRLMRYDINARLDPSHATQAYLRL